MKTKKHKRNKNTIGALRQANVDKMKESANEIREENRKITKYSDMKKKTEKKQAQEKK